MPVKTKLRLTQLSGSLGKATGGDGTLNAFTFAAGTDNRIFINMDTRNTNLLSLGSANVGVVIDGAVSGAQTGLGTGKLLVQAASVADDDFLRIAGSSIEGLSAAETLAAIGGQASDAQLTDVAGLAVGDGNFIVGDGSNFIVESGATARTSLGLGDAAVLAKGLNANQLVQVEANLGGDLFIRTHASNKTVVGRSAANVLNDIGAQATLVFGIGNNNSLRADANLSNDDFLKVAGSQIEGRTYAETLSDIGAQASLGSIGASVSINSQKLTSLGTPTLIGDAATKGYVDSLVAGLRWLKPVKVATTGELNNNASSVVYVDADNELKKSSDGALANQDGEPLTFNNTEASADRILVKNQAGLKGFLQFSIDTVPAVDETLEMEVNDLYYKITFTDLTTGAGWGGGNGLSRGAEKTVNIKRNTGGENETSIATAVALLFNPEKNITASGTAEVVRIEQSNPQDNTVAWDVDNGNSTAGFDTETAGSGISSRNGIYWAYAQGDGSNPWKLRRATDAIDMGELSAAAVFIERGSVNQDAAFVQTVDVGGGDSIDDVHQAWSQFTGGAGTTASLGVKKTGSDFQMDILTLSTLGAALAAGDELAFMDDSDSDVTKAVTITQLLGGFSGNGIQVNGAALELDIKADSGILFDGAELSLSLGASGIAGTLAVPDGGTGASSLTDGGILLGSGAGAITAMGVLSAGQLIVGDGSTDPNAESGDTLRISIGVGSTSVPQIQSIELGHANDTTISRKGAGVLQVQTNELYVQGGTDVAIADGGTGASALDDILVGSGLSVANGGATIIGGDCTVSLDAGLANLAGVAMGSDKMYYTSGDNVHAAADLTATGRSILDDANIAAVRTTIGSTTVGDNIFTLTNPGAVTFLRMNANNTVTARSAVNLKSDLGIVGGTTTKFNKIFTSILPEDGNLGTGIGAGNYGAQHVSTDVFLNGQLLLGHADVNINDYYPGAGGGDIKFNFACEIGDVLQVIVRS